MVATEGEEREGEEEKREREREREREAGNCKLPQFQFGLRSN